MTSYSVNKGSNFVSHSKKTQRIQLTFQDQVLITKQKRTTFQRRYFPWIRIDQIKKDLAKNFFLNKLQWQQLRLFCKNIQLDNKKRFFDNNVEQNNDIIIKKIQQISTPQHGIINPYQIFKITPQQIHALILAVESGLSVGRKPKLSQQGTSGTYFLQNHQKKKIAIFKPHDEQPFTPSNPRGYIGNLGGNGIRKGILSGQAATRQVAAYLLDINNFHKVPATTYVQFYHPSFKYQQIIDSIPIVSDTQNDLKKLKTKHGSLQQFAQSHDVAGNLGAHQFDTQQVHRIGILDLRILNCDRNQANILVKKVIAIDSRTQKQAKTKIYMIPIDHGLSFPDNFQIYQYQMVWMAYPQSRAPFSQKSLDFIKKIDPDQDCRTLRQKLGFRQICLRNFKIAQIFLKRMAKQGFTLYQIGQKVYRKDDDISSEEQQKQDNGQEKKAKQNLSELQKLIQRTQQIYNLVKQNGIRSTVQFQIGLIKMRKQKQQSLNFLEQKKIQSFKIQQIPQEKQQNQNQNGSQPRSQQLFDKLKKKASQNIDLVKQLQNNKFTQHKNSKKANMLAKQKLAQTSLQKLQHIKSLKKSIPKVRNISLPHLKKHNSGKPRRINNKKQILLDKKENANKWKKNQKWEQIFFHYFQDLLDQYMKKVKNQKIAAQKKAQQHKPRARFMSQSIDLEQVI